MARKRYCRIRQAHRGRCLTLAWIKDPATGMVVSCEGDLEQRYRARGWVGLFDQPKVPLVTPEEPEEDVADKPVTRRNTRRTTK